MDAKAIGNAELVESRKRPCLPTAPLAQCGLMGNVIRIAPPLSIDAARIDEMLEIIDASLAEVV